MTVSELIAALQKLPADLPVLTIINYEALEIDGARLTSDYVSSGCVILQT